MRLTEIFEYLNSEKRLGADYVQKHFSHIGPDEARELDKIRRRRMRKKKREKLR